ncbi:hypothetical protein KSE_58655 [Kitasatospora setae KM-6054]|uniref:Uncharacterized protein n=2 Tax=Kitasatospora setae TaxID=2066 RepID=E4N0F2_KITSK|nr:hypothetical protein [Kitasatospora setae KM-6054]BAJ31636.1 hypothetical protein KSE_58655 [Kitasatospora setae KM-6054]
MTKETRTGVSGGKPRPVRTDFVPPCPPSGEALSTRAAVGFGVGVAATPLGSGFTAGAAPVPPAGDAVTVGPATVTVGPGAVTVTVVCGRESSDTRAWVRNPPAKPAPRVTTATIAVTTALHPWRSIPPRRPGASAAGASAAGGSVGRGGAPGTDGGPEGRLGMVGPVTASPSSHAPLGR